MMAPRRRKTDLPWHRRAFEFTAAPLVDDFNGISITRLLAVFFALLVWHAVEGGHAITMNALWLALACIATAFGKSTFTFILRRMQFKGASTQEDRRERVDIHIDETHRVIQERRDSALGIEPAP